ncbi:MAG: ABC transporter ATP-binding protein [Clostridia bacterium]|nr:ABC transporter ATP-binding protein [Clostridia bacterium]
MARLIGLVKPLTGYMILAITMGLIGHLCASFITVFGGVAVVKALNFPVSLSFGLITALLIIFAFVRGILRYAEQACNHFIAFKLLALIRDKVFFALRRLCPAKLEGKDKGNLISVITSDIELLEVFYAHTISPTAIAILFTLAICTFLWFFSPVYALIALSAHLTVGMIIPFVISKMSGDDGQRFRDKSGYISTFILDSLRGLNEILQFNQGQKRLLQMKGLTEDISTDEERMKKVTGRNVALTNSVILIFDLVMLFASVFLFSKGKVDFSGVLIPVITLISSFGPAVALANLGSTLQNTFAAGNRVLDILDEEPVTEEITGKDKVLFEGAEAKNVSFSYGDEQILSDLSLTIPKDKIIGIVGRSGSGKSTLLKLFMRFWSVQKGEVCISEKNVSQINTSDLRDMESFVTQETHLFKDSIKNNIRIARLDATDEEIIEASKKASIHSFVLSLPDGYDTDVGELGDTLSGGEKQRIGLARAFLHNAPLMLLDEPTSNLDSLNEAVILRSLKQERQNRTVVLVSHRESTMRIADKVYSVEHGRMS